MPSKPRCGAVLNPLHALARNLAGLWIFNEGAGSRVADLAHRQDGIISGTNAPLWSPTNYLTVNDDPCDPSGDSLEFQGTATQTNSYIDCGTPPQLQDLVLTANEPMSIFVRFRRYPTANGGFCERNDGNAVNQGWLLGWNSPNLEFSTVRGTADVRAQITMPSADVWHNLVVCYDGSDTAANVNFYVDGLLTSHASDTNGSGTRGSDSSRNFYIGRTAFRSAGSWNGAISTVAIFRATYLDQRDAWDFQEDPWILARTRRFIVGDPVVPAPGPGFLRGGVGMEGGMRPLLQGGCNG